MRAKFIKAVLGWSNPETAGGESLRLYALDRGNSPRWAEDGGRTIERALIEYNGSTAEGDRYLVIRVGNRFVADELIDQICRVIDPMLED